MKKNSKLNEHTFPLPDINPKLSEIAMRDIKVKSRLHNVHLPCQEGGQRMARKLTVRFDKVDNLRWIHLYNK
jgi:hypothetical protein